ncbi:MAG: MBOAT family protein [Clostridium sp.]|nr:MBOAT family protein [Clostridium sp.]
MLFNSYFFIFLFLPLAIICYYGLNHINKPKAVLFFLTAVSFWFCGYNNIQYLAILLVSILVNYGFIRGVRFSSGRRKKLFLAADIVLNIGVLFYFKYCNFFIQNINGIFHKEIPLLNLFLPIGISFYTFQQLSYVIDAYRGECENYSFLQYVLFISFFPKLTQGPIVYHKDLLPQLQETKCARIDFENLCRGLYAFSLGLAKKVLLADNFARIVNAGYTDIPHLNSPTAFLVMVGYSLQIYFDFSGYCDMAYGVCYMLGIKLPLNFNSPYKAQSISDFWDRWHITLTKFFTRYVYIPLGGSRKGTVKTYVNILIVFLLSGLWHGANWTFILWGLMHGIAKVFERITKIDALNIPKFIKIGVTFLLVTFAWSLFRADSTRDAVSLWTRLFCGGFGGIHPQVIEKFQEIVEVSFLYRVFRMAGLGAFLERLPWLPATAFTVFCAAGCFTMKHTQEKTEGLQLTRQKLFTVAILLFWSIMSLSEISEFLYFNF